MSLVTSGFLDVGGKRLEYRSAGPMSDRTPTLLFLHHGLGSVSTWRHFPDRVGEATGLGILVFSRAGYGRSDPVDLPRPLSYMEDEASQVLGAVLDAAGVHKTVLVGHSDGASIAALYAGGTGDLRVRGLVLMSPHFFNEPICAETGAAVLAEYETGDLRMRLARHHDNVDTAFRGWIDTWLDPGFRHWDFTEYLDYIRVPILAIQGEDDRYGTLAQLDALDEVMCPVDKLVLPNCGHDPYLDQPEAVLAAISGFVERLVRSEGM